jgi:hypothetical protein
LIQWTLQQTEARTFLLLSADNNTSKMNRNAEIHFWPLVYMLLPLEKIFQNFKKIKTKISRLHLDILCEHAKFQGKSNIFRVLCKKIKDMSPKELFLVPNFLIQKKSFFRETTLLAHRTLRYTHGIFCQISLTF